MNEQLQQALVDIINKAISGIDASIGFLSAEIPDVVHQVLVWYAVESFIYFSISAVVVVGGIVLFNKKVGWSKAEAVKAYENGETWTRYYRGGQVTSLEYDAIMAMPDYYQSRALAIIVSLFGTLGLLLHLDWLKILIAPKLWLIEYAASIVK